MSDPLRPRDTTEEAYAAQVAVYRRMTPAQRVTMALAMSEEAREITLAGIRRHHPDWTDQQCRLELYRRMHGPELVELAWPDARSP